MRLSEILAKEVERSGGKMKIESVPFDMQPTAATLRRLEREISSQISANEAMSSRSMHNATKTSLK